MRRWQIGLCALAVLPATAWAADPVPIDYGSIDAYLMPRASIDAQWPESANLHNDSGNGFGLRVMSRVTDLVMFTGEYTRASHDSGVDTSEYRIGVGLAAPNTSGVFLTLERLALDLDNANGVALHGRLAGEVVAPVSAYVDAAYGAWDASRFFYDGFEFTVGATVDLPKPWGLFADYRIQLFDDGDTLDRVHTEQIRVGVRYRFDC